MEEVKTLADSLLVAAEQKTAWESHRMTSEYRTNLALLVGSQTKKGQANVNAEAILFKLFCDGWVAREGMRIKSARATNGVTNIISRIAYKTVAVAKKLKR